MRQAAFAIAVVAAIFATPLSASAQAPAPAQSITDFRIEGTGPVKLLLVPCMSCRWTAFEDFMSRNRDRYTMYAVTIPGFGGSQAPDLPMYSDEPLWHRNAVAALSEFVEQHDITDAIVVSHSWGAIISTELLAERADFARGWIILDTHVPITLPAGTHTQAERVAFADSLRTQYMEPLRDASAWASFNAVSPSMQSDRRVVYHGSFMATPRDVLFQYWRENVLVDINEQFASIGVPVLEVKSIARRDPDPSAAMAAYLAQYETAPHPARFQTVFLTNTGHFQVEERPEVIDDVVARFARGAAISDYIMPGEFAAEPAGAAPAAAGR